MSFLPKGVQALLLGVMFSCYKPRPALSAWQWAEKNVYLEKKQSQVSPGYYKSDLTPYTRRMQELATSTDYDGIYIEKSSQVGISEGAFNIIRFHVAEWPINIIYINDSEKEVKRIGQVRIRETLERCSATAAKLGTDKNKLTGLTLDLPEMVIYLGGGHCPGTLSNKPAALGIIDDADDHPEPKPGTPDNAEQMEERLKAGGPGAKMYVIGRPLKATGLTHRRYKVGTCEKYYVPCPHCGSYQELVLERLRYDHCKLPDGKTYDKVRVGNEAYLECHFKGCAGQIRTEHRYDMNLKGIWIATNPNPTPRICSMQIGDFYSPFVSLGKLAVEYIEAQEDGTGKKLDRFRQARQGLPVEDVEIKTNQKEVEACIGDYDRGTVPIKPLFMALAADKQGDVQKSVKGAFDEDGNLYIIDYYETLSEEELIPHALEQHVVPDSDLPMCCLLGAIDEGFKAKLEVRDFVQSTDGLFFAMKGRGGVQVQFTTYESKTIHKGEEMIVTHFDDDGFKKKLYKNMIGRRQDIIDGKLKCPRIYFSKGCEDRFFKELCGESFIMPVDRLGFSKGAWKKTGPNDWGDAVKELLVIWEMIGTQMAQAARAERAAAAVEKQKEAAGSLTKAA